MITKIHARWARRAVRRASNGCRALLAGILLLSIHADIQAAAIVLSKPVPLRAETLAQIRQARTEGDPAWKLIVFGFTHCKDVCPMSLANLSLLVKAAADERIRLGGVFVTVDPDRDTNDVLSGYAKSFGADIAYLRFEGDHLERFKAAFGVETVFYTKNAGNMSHYQVDHSTTAFLVDPGGNIRVMFDALKDVEDIAGILRRNKALFGS